MPRDNNLVIDKTPGIKLKKVIGVDCVVIEDKGKVKVDEVLLKTIT